MAALDKMNIGLKKMISSILLVTCALVISVCEMMNKATMNPPIEASTTVVFVSWTTMPCSSLAEWRMYSIHGDMTVYSFPFTPWSVGAADSSMMP